jgi:hypothetical protein
VGHAQGAARYGAALAPCNSFFLVGAPWASAVRLIEGAVTRQCAHKIETGPETFKDFLMMLAVGDYIDESPAEFVDRNAKQAAHRSRRRAPLICVSPINKKPDVAMSKARLAIP